MARILLAEALPVTREGLQRIIAANRDMLVAANAGNAQEVLQEVSKSHYDLLMLGTSVPGNGWLDLLKDLKNQRPNLPVLIVSAAADEDEAMRAFRAGASGYLTTECAPDELSDALRKVLGGGKYVSSSVSERLALDPENAAGKPLHELLSDREYQVMRSLASGKTVSEIAGEMSLSVKTISTYRSRLLEKLNLKNNVELAGYYTRHIDTRTVRCKGCGQDNPHAARFCAQCGAALDVVGESSPEASGPATGRTRTSTRSPKLLKTPRWFAFALGAAAIVAVVIVWRTQWVPSAVELKHDDGTPEAEIHADSGGYLIHFSPASVPFVIDKIRAYGAALPAERTQFELEIWDKGQKVIYSTTVPLTVFPAIATPAEARKESRWVEIPVPGIEVNSDFLVHVLAASSPLNGLVIGADDSTWNLHSSLTSLTSSGTYEMRDGWGNYKPDLWFADKNKVNWMVRAVGRNRGPSAPTAPAASTPVSTSTPGPRPSPTQSRPLPPLDAFMKGFTFADWKSFDAPPSDRGLYRPPGADQSLRDLAATGTNWISLLVNVGQETVSSTTLFRTQPRTATDAELHRIVDLAHGLGMRVLLLPSVALSSDPTHFSYQIGMAFSSEDRWQEWFASYRELINHYAEFSQEAGVDMLCVGDVLVGTTDRQEDWRRIVAEVRQRFKGPITYNGGGEEDRVGWWDAVDYIGMSPFYALTEKNDPTVGELKTAWTEKGYLALMENLSKQFNKPVIAMRMGYESKDGANRWPGTSYTMQLGLDLQEQADCYQAALEAMWGKPWLKGIFWWQWWVNQIGGPNDSGYTPVGKPAEAILKRFYLEK